MEENGTNNVHNSNIREVVENHTTLVAKKKGRPKAYDKNNARVVANEISKLMGLGMYDMTDLASTAFDDLTDQAIKGDSVAAQTIADAVSMTVLGYSMHDIAERLDVPVATVKDIQASEQFITLRNRVTASAVDKSKTFLGMASLKATKTLLSKLDSKNEKIQLSASTDILDRLGIKAEQKVHITAEGSMMSNKTDEELMAIINMPEDIQLPTSKKGGSTDGEPTTRTES